MHSTPQEGGLNSATAAPARSAELPTNGASPPARRKLRALGSRTTKLMLAAAVASLGTPAIALAAYSPANTTGMAVMTGETGDSWNGALRSDGVKKNADGTRTATYTGIAHSDLVHYQAYGLTTAVTFDASGAITAINLSSGNDTFAGSWGYKNIDKVMDPVEGYLPDGCSFKPVRNADGTYTLALEDANKYGSSIVGLTVLTIGDDGSNILASEDEIYTVGSGREATTAYRNFDPATSTLTIAPENASTNLVKVTFSIGAESALMFNAYFAIAADGSIDTSNSSAVNKYVDAIQPTTWEIDPDLTNTMAETNRNKWTAVLATVVLQRQLQSWSASLKSGFSAAGEISDLDVVSGATKTSEPLIKALEQSVLDGYVKSVAENVKVTIDGGDIDLNSDPADRSTVTKNAKGEYVLTNVFPYGEDRTATHGTTLDTISIYSAAGATTADVAAMSKNRSKYKALATFDPKTLIGYEEDDGDPIYADNWSEFVDLEGRISLDYSATDGTAPIVVTVNDSSITHVAMTYTIGHGTITLVYSLEQMEAAGKVQTQIAALTTSSTAAKVKAARTAYNALSTDVRGFVTNIDKLRKLENSVAAKTAGTAKTVSLKAGKSKKLSAVTSGNGTKVTYKAVSKSGVSITAAGKISVKKTAKAGKVVLSTKALCGDASKSFKITVKVAK